MRWLLTTTGRPRTCALVGSIATLCALAAVADLVARAVAEALVDVEVTP